MLCKYVSFYYIYSMALAHQVFVFCVISSDLVRMAIYSVQKVNTCGTHARYTYLYQG